MILHRRSQAQLLAMKRQRGTGRGEGEARAAELLQIACCARQRGERSLRRCCLTPNTAEVDLKSVKEHRFNQLSYDRISAISFLDQLATADSLRTCLG